MKKLVIEWSCHDSGIVRFAFDEMGITEEEFNAMNDEGREGIIRDTYQLPYGNIDLDRYYISKVNANGR